MAAVDPTGLSVCSIELQAALREALPPGTSTPGGDSKARRHESAHWASRWSKTVWSSRPRSSSSNPFSRPTSCPASSGSARSVRPSTPWKPSGWLLEGQSFVFEADIKNFFGSIDHDRLSSWSADVSRTDALNLLRQSLREGVLDRGVVTESVSGTPQGGVISPSWPTSICTPSTGSGPTWHRRSRPLCGRLRGAGTSQSSSRGSRTAGDRHLGDLGLASIETRPEWSTSGREERLRLPRVPSPCPHVREALGAEADRPLLPPPLASLRSMKRAARIKAMTARSQVGQQLNA